MNISFLILTHGEPQAFDLIDYIEANKGKGDEIIVLNDPTTPEYERELKAKGVTLINNKLKYSYSEHRNYGLQHCKGDFVFALDADERPAKYLLDNLRKIIEQSKAEVIWLPRLNIFQGVTIQDAQLYGWDISDGLVNWTTGDYQCRLFKNKIGLKWYGNLHERLQIPENTKQVTLEKDAIFAIVHRKTIEQQRASNAHYNKVYTEAENRGIKC